MIIISITDITHRYYQMFIINNTATDTRDN